MDLLYKKSYVIITSGEFMDTNTLTFANTWGPIIGTVAGLFIVMMMAFSKIIEREYKKKEKEKRKNRN